MKVYFLKVYKLRLSFGVSRIFHSIRPKEKGILKYEAIFYINIIINLLIRFFIPWLVYRIVGFSYSLLVLLFCNSFTLGCFFFWKIFQKRYTIILLFT